MTHPIPDFPGFISFMLGKGHTLNRCRDNCQDAGEHVHLHSPDGSDGIIWAGGMVSEFDLTQPARLIYPGRGNLPPLFLGVPELDWTVQSGGWRLIIRDGTIRGLTEV